MRSLKSAWVLSLLIGLPLLAPPARANTSFEFLFSTDRVQNDNQFFLNCTVNDYGYSRQDVTPVMTRIHDWDNDLPVVLFVARQSGRSPDYVARLRSRGYAWSSVFQRCGVSYDVLFAGFDRDPGPPYGRAWGYWRQHHRVVRFSDNDIRGLVRLQTAHHVSGASVVEIAHARGRGQQVDRFVADHKGHHDGSDYRGRNDRGDDHHQDRNQDRSQDRNQGRDRDNGHDHRDH